MHLESLPPQKNSKCMHYSDLTRVVHLVLLGGCEVSVDLMDAIGLRVL